MIFIVKLLKSLKFITLLLPLCLFAASDDAKVVKVSGRATKLLPGSMSASLVKIGDKIPQDTSLVTTRRSFIVLSLADDSKVTIGPRSKIVLSYSANESGSVLSLLKGKLRSKVEKNKNKKLYITTRSAALGVRGTDFQTIYNPQNSITNLLTFNGEVEIAKINESDIKYKTKVVNSYKRTDSNKVKVVSESYRVPVIGTRDVETLLRDKEPELVKAGQFSGTVSSFDSISKPVKISPVQLSLLYNNDTLSEPTSTSPREINDSKNIGTIFQADQVAPLEGYVDVANKEFAPKSGGVIDLESGLYIPPGKNSVFDEKKRVYVAKSIGRLDSATGAFIPPQGLRVDPVLGFQPKKKSKKFTPASKRRLTVISKALNTEMKADLLVKNKQDEVSHIYDSLTLKERFSKDHLIFNFSAYDFEVEESENSANRNGREDFVDAKSFELEWLLAGSGNYRPRLMFGLASSGNTERQRKYVKPGDQLFSIGVGVDFYFNSEVYISSDVTIREHLVPSYNTDLTASLVSVALNQVAVGLNYDFYRYKRLLLFSYFKLNTNFYKSDKDVSVKNGLGFRVGLGAEYNLNRRSSIQLSLAHREQNYRVRNNFFNSKVRSLKSGLSLNYKHSF